MYVYEIEGKKAKSRWWKVLVVIISICLVTVIYSGVRRIAYGWEKPNAHVPHDSLKGEGFKGCQKLAIGCSKTYSDLYNFTDEVTKQKAEGVTWFYEVQTIQASVTQYSPTDSCHYPTEEGCLTASGKVAKAGITVACPYEIPLGSKVEINGKEYVCQDRTARWVQAKWPNTFDVFTGDHGGAVKWGRQTIKVTVEYAP